MTDPRQPSVPAVQDDDAPFHSEPGVGIERNRRDEELRAEGWERRFVGAPPRLDESRELYESMGLEVLLDPVTEEELRTECAGCALALALFRVIYTRRAT